MNTSERVKGLILEIFPRFNGDNSLRGQLDSLAFFALLPRLEREFGIQIFSMEATPANFDSVEGIARLVEAKLRNP